MTPTKSYIHKLNVARFEALLAQEQSAEHKRVLSNLLAEEQALLSETQRLEQRRNNPTIDWPEPRSS